MGHIKRSHLSEAKLTLPTQSIVNAGAGTISPIWEMIRNNTQENHTLTELRDTLLPRLISGKLRIPDAEKLLAEAPV
jgi:type I restriction enzyme S subunit